MDVVNLVEGGKHEGKNVEGGKHEGKNARKTEKYGDNKSPY
jgi:hypothetical protein